MVGRNNITPRPPARLTRVIFRLDINQLVKTGDMLLWRDTPEPGWRRRRHELDPFGQWPEEKIMTKEIALVRIEVGAKSPLVLHHAPKLADDPVGKTKTLHDLWTHLLGRGHFLQRDLCPNRLPDRSVGLIYWPQSNQREISLGSGVVVAVEAVILEKELCKSLKILFHRFPRHVGPLVRRSRQN
jgi:hypothetical protein